MLTFNEIKLNTERLVTSDARAQITDFKPELEKLADLNWSLNAEQLTPGIAQNRNYHLLRAIKTLNYLLIEGNNSSAISDVASTLCHKLMPSVKYGLHANQAFVLASLGGANNQQSEDINRGFIVNAMGASIRAETSYGHDLFELLNQKHLFEGRPTDTKHPIGLRHHKIRDISHKLQLTQEDLAACAGVVIEDNLFKYGVQLRLGKHIHTGLLQLEIDQVKLLAYEFLPKDELKVVMPHIQAVYTRVDSLSSSLLPPHRNLI